MNDPHLPESSANGCPPADRLRAFARGRARPDEVDHIVAHLAHCACCSAFLLTLPETVAGAVESVREVPADARAVTTVAVRFPLDDPRAAPPPEDLPALRLGRYRIQRLLGKGGFGTVYAAHDEDLDRPVAVKVPYAHRLVTAGQPEAYHAEARLHASLDHPHIVPIYDVGRTAEIPFYLVSKLIDGEDLGDRIKRGRPGFREAAVMLVPVAEALDHLHGRGLVHRDVKPRNILLDEDGNPYLTDFGLAVRSAQLQEGQAAEGVLAGTPAYMSPEQAHGAGERVDARTDVYSMGVVLYELLTGEKPFPGNSSTLLHRIQHEPLRPPHALVSQVPAELEAICLKAMARDPAQRYERIGEMADDLRRFLDGPPRPPESRLRRPALLAGLMLVAFTALMALVRFWSGPGAGQPASRGLPVLVSTRPPGAALSFFPLDGETGLPQADKVVRGRSGAQVRLEPGRYLVVAVLAEKSNQPVRFHEVFRLVPTRGSAMPGTFRHLRWRFRDGVVELPEIVLPAAEVHRGMCLIPEATDFPLGGGRHLPAAHRRRVPAFYLDTTEVAAGSFARWLNGPQRPLPDPVNPQRAAAGVTWDQAVAYAEHAGKRLPDEIEYEYAATALCRSAYPWGKSPPALPDKRWPLGPVGQPREDCLQLPGQPTVFGLYSNVAEWTSSWAGGYPGSHLGEPQPRLRAVRGAPLAVVRGQLDRPGEVFGPRERLLVDDNSRLPGLGFRCARSARPRLGRGDFVALPEP